MESELTKELQTWHMDFHLNWDLERGNEWTWMEAWVVGVVRGVKISFLCGYAALTLSSTNEHCLESFLEPFLLWDWTVFLDVS